MSSNLLDVSKTSPVILVKDSVSQGGIGLLKSLVQSVSHHVTKIHVLLYELNSETLTAGLPVDVIRRMQIYDIASDPLDWYEENNLTIDGDIMGYIRKSSDSASDEKVAILIDSLRSLIFHRAPPYTCQVLHKLAHRRDATGAEVGHVLSLVHGDLHNETTLLQIEHTATSVLTVSPPVTKGFNVSCQILHKRSSGKLIRVNEEYKFADNFQVIESQEIKTLTEAANVISSVDPTSNLTFNLNLNDSEKEARSQLNLPYLYNKNRQEEVLKKSVGEGKIFYQPDEADDFDEEDPDDDLDI